MSNPVPFLSASEAAERFGVTTKALRIYELRGLLTPGRTPAGYRAYGPDEMRRGSEIVALRALGLSLAQVERVLGGDPQSLEGALGAHQASLERNVQELSGSIDKIRRIRARLAQGQSPSNEELVKLRESSTAIDIALDLPWPWGGERFELGVRPINYIIGPLGSGKTRLAMRLAEAQPNAVFLGLERSKDAEAIVTRVTANASLKSRFDQALAWLLGEGATRSNALTALLVGLETEAASALVIDMIEDGLDQATQEALIPYLHQRAEAGGCVLFLTTRSTAILDLSAVGPDESIILCPANHSPPTRVLPYPGTPGYEAVATCLASPDVRTRIACCPAAA